MNTYGDLLAKLLAGQQPETPVTPTPLAEAADAVTTPAPAATVPLAEAAKPFFPSAPPPVPQVTAPSIGPTTTRMPTTKDVLAENKAAVTAQAQGIEEESAAKEQRAAYLADQRLAALQQEAQAAEVLGKARENIAKHTQDRMTKVNSEIDELTRQKPDAGSYWKSQGTLGTILQLIGVGLGGYQSKGGPNVALQLLQTQIDRHVQAETRDYQQKLEALRERRGAAKEEQAGQLDALEFKVARQVDANNRVMKMIDAAASKYDSPEIQARKKQMMGDLMAKNAALLEGVRSKSVAEGQENARIGLQAQGLGLERQRFGLEQERFGEQKRQYDITTLREIAEAQQKGDAAKAKQLQDERERAVFSIKDPETGKAVAAPRPEVADKINAMNL